MTRSISFHARRIPPAWGATVILFALTTPWQLRGGEPLIATQYQQRVHVEADFPGNRIDETYGTNGGDLGVVVSTPGVIPLTSYEVRGDPETVDDFLALSEVLNGYSYSYRDSPDEPTSITLNSQTHVDVFTITFPGSDLVAEKEAVARLDTIAADLPSPNDWGSAFRYTLTWFVGKTQLSQYTELTHESFVDIAEGTVHVEAPQFPAGTYKTTDSAMLRQSKAVSMEGSEGGLPLDAPLAATIHSNIGLFHKWPPEVFAARLDPFYHDRHSQVVEYIDLRLFDAEEGTSQSRPLRPDEIDGLIYKFKNIPSGLWFDPTPAKGFTYDILDDDVLFDEILDFPTGLDGPVTVSVDGQFLGEFGPGDHVDFKSIYGSGVRQFEVSGLAPYAQADDDSPGFALQLGFSEETASFSMTAQVVTGVAPGTMLSPAAIVGTDLGTFSGDVPLSQIIDGSGLATPFVSGETSFDSYFASGDDLSADSLYSNNWQSQAAFDGDVMGYVDLDLGDLYAVDSLAIWNGTIEELTVLVSESAEGPWQEAGVFALANQTPTLYSRFNPEVLALDAEHNARYLRLQVNSAYPFLSSEEFAYAIIGEVAARVSNAWIPLPGDFNGDGAVDLTDFNILKTNFGAAGGLGEGDANGDGIVDLLDFNILKDGFGQRASVPEPPSGVFLALLTAGAMRRDHRIAGKRRRLAA